MTNKIEKLDGCVDEGKKRKILTTLDLIEIISDKIDEIIDVVNEQKESIQEFWQLLKHRINDVELSQCTTNERLIEIEKHIDKLDQKKTIDDLCAHSPIFKEYWEKNKWQYQDIPKQDDIKLETEYTMQEPIEIQLSKLEKGCWYLAKIIVGDIWLNHVFEFKHLNHARVNYACLICIDGCNKGSIVWDDFIYDIQIDAKSIKKLSEEL
jgi:hypothetical protein